jgi:hypothetical protein
VAETSRWRLFYLLHISQPSHDRALYRAIHDRQVQSILEWGVGSGRRALRMIQAAQRRFPGTQVRYAGVDQFEAGAPGDGAGMPLKSAYQTLRVTGASIRLLPGDPLTAISRAANSMAKVDLLVVSAALDWHGLARTWLYVPRMLRDRSLVVCEQTAADGRKASFRVLSARHIEELAQRAAGRRAA